MNNVAGNIWKYLIFEIAHRRHYIPILAIYFLTIPNTTAQQIGFYTAIGFFSSFLFEIPSGFLSDKFGHKKTLILSRILMIASTASFIFIQNFYGFILGSICLQTSNSFSSGTKEAFLHNTLITLKKDEEYTRIVSKIGANASIASMVLIIALPFLTKISINLPLKINLIFDVIGLLIALSFISPIEQFHTKKINLGSVKTLLKKMLNTGFYPLSLFFGSIGGFLIASSGFRYVYLESLSFPIIFVGLVMGFSRLIWFFIGHKAHLLEERLPMKKLILFEIFLFPGLYFLVVYLSNPYIIGTLFALSAGYYWGRNQLINSFFLNKLSLDKNLKATMLSIKSQIMSIILTGFSFIAGIAMGISYKVGYFTITCILFASLIISGTYLRKKYLS